jgi:WhiB family redox-sensing transcriptional regulator
MSHHTGSVPDTPRATDWRDNAACTDQESDLFFASELTATGKADVRHAKTICWRCPSLQPCGQWALETRQAFGVWGGMSERERRRILRRRGVRLPDDPDATATGTAA